jgi:hypothetical protein
MLKSKIMKSKREFLKVVSNVKLANAVINQIGLPFKELLQNANDYTNASNGVNGFIYYDETHKFAVKNRKAIVQLLEETAEQMDTNVIDLVKGFNCLEVDNDDLKDLYKFLGGAKVEQCSITNALAWFAMEQIIYELINYKENE